MLERIGYHPRMDRWVRAADTVLGRVAAVDGGVVSVLTGAGPVRATTGGALLARMAVDHRDGPAVGDWCVLRSWPDGRVTVERVLPRRTVLLGGRPGDGRPDPAREVVCANVDVAAVVGGPPVTAGPTVVVHHGRDVEVVTVDPEDEHAVEALLARLGGRSTLAVTGSRGAGPSLVDVLVGAPVLTRPRQARRGCELVPLPSGGAVVDVTDPPPGPLSRAAAGRTSAVRPREALR